MMFNNHLLIKGKSVVPNAQNGWEISIEMVSGCLADEGELG